MILGKVVRPHVGPPRRSGLRYRRLVDHVEPYPLPVESVATPDGTPLAEVTFAAFREGRLAATELRATPHTLRRQAAVARAAGRAPLAANLERAAELAPVPDALVLEVYTALRPGRATGSELEGLAARLEHEFGAVAVAAFVREAAAVAQQRERRA